MDREVDANWFEELRLGVDVLDVQHHYIIELILGFDRGGKSTDTSKILMDLMRYTREHFQAEESLMESEGYPGIVRHRGLHDDLLKDVVRFAAGNLADPQEQRELHQILRAWLIRHILQEDADFAQFLKTRSA